VNDDIELRRTAQIPQWWVSSTVVVAIDELNTVAASWKFDSE